MAGLGKDFGQILLFILELYPFGLLHPQLSNLPIAHLNFYFVPISPMIQSIRARV